MLFRDYSSSPLFRNYLRVFSLDVIVKALAFVLLPLYLHLMSQAEYGLYGYIVAIISAFSLVLNFGVYAAQSKLYHDYPEEQRGSVLFTLNVVLCIFMLAVLTVSVLSRADFMVAEFLFHSPIDYARFRLPILLGVVVSIYSLMLANYFLTSEDIRRVQLFNLCRFVAINLSALIALWLLRDTDQALVRVTYANIAECMVILVFSVSYLRRMRANFDTRVAVKSFRTSFPVMVSGAIGLFVNLGDRYFIEKYGTLSDLSIYNLALTFAGIIPLAFASFQNVWLPQVLKERNPDVNRTRSRTMMVRIGVGFMLLSAVIMGVLHFMLMVQVIDPQYSAIMPLLPMLLVTAIIAALAGMYSNLLIYLDRLHIIIFVGVAMAFFSVILNWQLVPRFNVYGAAISSLAVNLGFFVSYSLAVRYLHGKRPSVPARVSDVAI